MEKPVALCFQQKAWSEKSEFCTKVCRFADECSDGRNKESKRSIVNGDYKSGVISFKELVQKRFAILKADVEKQEREETLFEYLEKRV